VGGNSYHANDPDAADAVGRDAGGRDAAMRLLRLPRMGAAG